MFMAAFVGYGIDRVLQLFNKVFAKWRFAKLMKLNLVNINKTFQNDGEVLQVLEDINLSVSEGEFVSLLGSLLVVAKQLY